EAGGGVGVAVLGGDRDVEGAARGLGADRAAAGVGDRERGDRVRADRERGAVVGAEAGGGEVEALRVAGVVDPEAAEGGDTAGGGRGQGALEAAGAAAEGGGDDGRAVSGAEVAEL